LQLLRYVLDCKRCTASAEPIFLNSGHHPTKIVFALVLYITRDHRGISDRTGSVP